MALTTLDECEYGLQPVFWFSCPTCEKRLKSTWFLLEDDDHCTACGSTFEFVVFPQDEFTVFEMHVADQDILRCGEAYMDCYGCERQLNVGEFIDSRDYQCSCGMHHHVEIAVETTDEPDPDVEKFCYRCREPAPLHKIETHHVSYDDPELVVDLCRECHREIETGDTDDELAPETVPNGTAGEVIARTQKF